MFKKETTEGAKKIDFKGKMKHIIVLCVMAVIAIALIVGDVFAYSYASIISGFFGSNEQISGDSAAIEEAAKSGDELVRKIGNEGVVLMKNGNNSKGKPTLPLEKPADGNIKVNVFGWGATDSGFVLAGNGSGRSYVHEDNKVTLLQAFEQNGFEYNKEIIQIYENWCTTEDQDWGENANWNNRYNTKLKEPVTDTSFPTDVVGRAKNFSDTAIIVLSRYSGEYLGRIYDYQPKHDLPRDDTRSFGEISTEEESLIKMCTSNFENVIVIFNTGSIMDMTFLDDPSFGTIDAALNVGYMGQSGATAIPKILSGEVCPSGKLANTIVYDPDVNEIGRVNGWATDIVYEEDIYLGYKWYETADVEGYYSDREKFGKTGYDAVVQYPFGSGLSYTTFDWEIVSLSIPSGEVINSESEIKIQVRVTNTGEVAGKDVVELYLTAPYDKGSEDGNIEKPHVSLINFEKTEEIQPGDYDIVEFTVTPYEMASFDAYDSNNNLITGWELEDGLYQLKLMTDSHHVKDMENGIIEYNVEFAKSFRKDPVTNTRVKVRFTGDLAYGGCSLDGSTLGTDWTYLSREDFAGTMPTTLAEQPSGNKVNEYKYTYDGYDNDPAYQTMPTTEVESNLRLVTGEDGQYITKNQFDGKDNVDFAFKFNDELMFELGNPDNWDSETWDKLLNQLSTQELRDLVEGGGYGSQSVESIGKPRYLEYDGPSGFNRTNMSPNVPGSKFTALPAENLVGQTWNKYLSYQAGQIIGLDGQNFGINGIYAPCVNLHRDSLAGRNYECYSEDAVISGQLAAAFIKGAKSNGVHCYLKHLALYDSNPYTDKRVWLTEQNFRENYLRPFEIAIKEGGANAIMVSFNKIGPNWAGANQALINGIVRDEWGFKGTIITDYSDGSDSVMDVHDGLRAGLNLELNPKYPSTNTHGVVDMNDPVEVNLSRESAKSIVYTVCNTYWYAMTDTSGDDAYKTTISAPKPIELGFAWWVVVLWVVNVSVFGVIIWQSVMLFIPDRKKVTANGAPEPDGTKPQKIRVKKLSKVERLKAENEQLRLELDRYISVYGKDIPDTNNVSEQPADTDKKDGQ